MTSFKTDNDYFELCEFIEENTPYFTNESITESFKHEKYIQFHNKIYSYEYKGDKQKIKYIDNHYKPYLIRFCNIQIIPATIPGTGRIEISEFKISLREAFLSFHCMSLRYTKLVLESASMFLQIIY